MGNLGVPELLIIAFIVIVVFGAKKLPDLGAGLGKAIRDFKGAIKEPPPPPPPATEEKKEEPQKITK
jgi:sec-independent protein translocase protein TatA